MFNPIIQKQILLLELKDIYVLFLFLNFRKYYYFFYKFWLWSHFILKKNNYAIVWNDWESFFEIKMGPNFFFLDEITQDTFIYDK